MCNVNNAVTGAYPKVPSATDKGVYYIYLTCDVFCVSRYRTNTSKHHHG